MSTDPTSFKWELDVETGVQDEPVVHLTALRICDECGDEEPLRSECLNCGRTGYLDY